METRCDYCGTEQALVYCKSDSAKLCLNCDIYVRSVNALSLRPTQSLVCEKCFSQPALIDCLNEKVLLCQRCYWTTSDGSSLGHKVQILNSYSGCPSPAGFTRTWPSMLESSVSNLSDECTKMKELHDWDGLSTFTVIPTQNLMDRSSFFFIESNLPKMIHEECSDLDICEGINFDDVPLNFNASDDIMGCSSFDHTKCYQYNENSFKEEKKIDLDSMFLPALPGNVVPSLSFSMSNITGESNATDITDCGISPGILIGDSSWESNVEISFSPKSREEAKKRYNQKKSKRVFGKQIRYASRKARADTRKRVKGRFVKFGEAFQYQSSVTMN